MDAIKNAMKFFGGIVLISLAACTEKPKDEDLSTQTKYACAVSGLAYQQANWVADIAENSDGMIAVGAHCDSNGKRWQAHFISPESQRTMRPISEISGQATGISWESSVLMTGYEETPSPRWVTLRFDQNWLETDRLTDPSKALGISSHAKFSWVYGYTESPAKQATIRTSHDDGQTWQTTLSTDEAYQVSSVAYWGDGVVVAAALQETSIELIEETAEGLDNATPEIRDGFSTRLYRSDDYGQNWYVFHQVHVSPNSSHRVLGMAVDSQHNLYIVGDIESTIRGTDYQAAFIQKISLSGEAQTLETYAFSLDPPRTSAISIAIDEHDHLHYLIRGFSNREQLHNSILYRQRFTWIVRSSADAGESFHNTDEYQLHWGNTTLPMKIRNTGSALRAVGMENLPKNPTETETFSRGLIRTLTDSLWDIHTLFE